MEILAVSIGELPAQLGQIFYFIVLPMLLLAGIGYTIQRVLGLDMPTLLRLNFYFVMPGIIYFSLVDSKVTAGDVGLVVLFTLGVLALNGVVTYAVARLRGIRGEYRTVMVMTTILHNSGNYGLPLQELAWRQYSLSTPAASLQAFVMITQNIFTFTIGVLLAASGRKDRHWKQNLMHIVRFPPIYALAAALVTIQTRNWLGESAGAVGEAMRPFWDVITYVKNAFFAVALATLGAQLATVAKAKHAYPIRWSVVLRLLVGPLIGVGVIYATGLNGFMAQVLLISTTTPTAVNCMLLCMQFDNHPDYAARAVFYSTLLSPITITLVIFLARSGLLPQLMVQ